MGGRYSLVGSKHDDEFLGPEDDVTLKPDFWVNYLWKRIVGTDVHAVDLSEDYNGTLRAYAFSGAAPSPWAEAKERDASIVVINLANATREVVIDAAGFDSIPLAWILTAADGAAGVTTLMNGKALPAEISDGQEIEVIPVAGVFPPEEALILPPLSITFGFMTPT